MNNKGFTLVELLATLVIISVLGAIASVSVIKYINTTKDKAEDKFIKEITNQIENYVSYNSSNFTKTITSYTFTKEQIEGANNWGNSSTSTAWKMKLNDKDNKFTLGDLEQITDGGKFINPKNEKECADSTVITVYMDSEFVYYYYVDLSKSNCGIDSSKNIDTRLSTLKSAMGE